MITTFEGRMGQGKTLGMTGLAVLHRVGELVRAVEIAQNAPLGTYDYQNYKDELTFPQYVDALENEKYDETSVVKIASNYHLAHIKHEYMDFAAFAATMQGAEDGSLILHKTLFLLDEMYLWLDARLSSSKMNRAVNNFTVETRKRGIDLYGTTHSLSKVDKRFRGAVDIKATCRFEPRTQTCRIRFRDLHTGHKVTKRLYGPVIYPFYDTEEIVRPQGKPYRLSKEYVT